MNTNKQKQYMVIHNVRHDEKLQKYLEQICHDEHVQIIEEYVSNNWFEQRPSIYAEFKASAISDMLLCSYNEDKLAYIKYLYDDYEKKYMLAKNSVIKAIEETGFDESDAVDTMIRDDLSNGWKVTVLDNTRENVKAWATSSWTVDFNNNWTNMSLKTKKPQPTKQKSKLEKFYSFIQDWEYEIWSFIFGASVSSLFFITVLTLKHFMVK